MIEIQEKNKCSGCTACFNSCPVGAISMEPDFEGFLYPVIDKNKCINCGICEKKCPVLNQEKKNIKDIKSYALRVKDIKTLENSTSGGFFSPIAKYVINNNGIVVGVGYDDNKRIVHKFAKEIEEIKEFKGSKYVQSDLGDAFKKIKGFLEKGIVVLFSGTPCQVEGLLKYLDKDYEKLILVDLICHGTPSPKLWKKYLDYQEKKYDSKIKEINFRNKTYGYHSGTMKLVFENGKVYYGSARVDFMLKSFFKEISSRPACYNCKFKTRYHKSDFTIYDCWNISKLCENVKDDDKGFTNIIVNTEKGEKILKLLKDEFEIYSVNLDKQIKLDGIMVEQSAVPHNMRDEYYKELDKTNLKKHINKFIPITLKDYVIEYVKSLIYKVGFLNYIKKFIKK